MAPGMAPGMGMPGMVPGMTPGMAPGMGMPGMPGAQPGMPGMPGMAPGMAPGMGMPATSGMAMPATSGMAMPATSVMTGLPVGGSPHTSGTSTPTPQHLDWAIPEHTKAKYTATFQATDRGRTGFLAGVQARNILLQSGLPQAILAKVWGLSDVDNDGRLSTEEFILAGHLCELATKGEPLPATLPPNMIPPSMRKGGAVVSAATPGADVVSPTTFEDKRKENFTKGDL